MKFRNLLLLSLLCLGVGMEDMSHAANGNFGDSVAATAVGNTGVGSNTGSVSNPWIVEDCFDLQNIDISNEYTSLPDPGNTLSHNYLLAPLVGDAIDCSMATSGDQGGGDI